MKTPEIYPQPTPQESSREVFHLNMLAQRLDEEGNLNAQIEQVRMAGLTYMGLNRWFQNEINLNPQVLDDHSLFEKYNKAQQRAHSRLLRELGILSELVGREIPHLNDLAKNRDEARIWAVDEFKNAPALTPMEAEKSLAETTQE